MSAFCEKEEFRLIEGFKACAWVRERCLMAVLADFRLWSARDQPLEFKIWMVKSERRWNSQALGFLAGKPRIPNGHLIAQQSAAIRTVKKNLLKSKTAVTIRFGLENKSHNKINCFLARATAVLFLRPPWFAFRFHSAVCGPWIRLSFFSLLQKLRVFPQLTTAVPFRCKQIIAIEIASYRPLSSFAVLRMDTAAWWRVG